MRLTIVLIIHNCLISLLSFSQSSTLNTGDTLPPITFENILNCKTSQLSLSDFKGKYIILDFWNHSCVPCIAALPKLDSLQCLYENNLQIILVNKESRDSTLKFFSKRKKIKMPGLLMITGDKKLHDLFPSDGYPYHVWIDTAGIIRNISGGYNTTAEHVQNFLAGKNIVLKNPTQKKMNIETFLADHKLKTLVSSSTISLCSDEWNPGGANGEPLRNGTLVRLARHCSSILDLFIAAYTENGKYNFYTDYSLKFEAENVYPYIIPADKNLYDDWLQKHAFTYELILPASRKAEMFKIMQQDLQSHFDLKAEIRITKVPAIILRRLRHSVLNLLAKETLNETFRYRSDMSDSSYYFLNYPVEKFVDYLMGWVSYHYPFFNELNETGNLDICIREKSVDPFNIDYLNQDLLKHGLTLTIEQREIPVLYISNK